MSGPTVDGMANVLKPTLEELEMVARLRTDESLAEARRIVAVHDCVIVSRLFWEEAAGAVRFMAAEIAKQKIAAQKAATP